MPEILTRLSPHNLDLKGRIVGAFFSNPFLNLGCEELVARFGNEEELQDALSDLCACGVLKKNNTHYVFASEAGIYADIEGWCLALGGENAALRQQVVERETLGRLQAQLAVSQQEVGAILEIVPAGVFFLDRFGHLLKCNTQGAKLLGVSEHQADFDLCARLGLDLAHVLSHPVDREEEGSPPLAVTARPFVSATREAGVVISVQDISMRRKLEAEAERLRQDFFSMIRHELRKPLMTIERGLAEIGDGKAAALARTAAVHMGEMVDDMLLLARLERDPLAVTAGCDISLQFLLAGSDLAFRAKAEAALVTLKLIMPEIEVMFCGDDRRLSQVVGNLLDNAIKFTPQGGCVTLSGGSDDKWVWVEVADTGQGIPIEERSKILEKFYQVESESREQGLGLGLAICSKIVAAHNGVLKIEESETGGTRIIVMLPLEIS